MSFIQCLALPAKYARIERKIENISAHLASAMPDIVYCENTFKAICNKYATNNGAYLMQALIEIGIVEKQEITYCKSCNSKIDDCFCGKYEEAIDIRYVVVGELMRLIDDIKKQLPNETYFISFYTGEGKSQASQLHAELTKNGLKGFLSDESLQSGSQWRTDIINNLRKSKIFFCIETPCYHNRPRCQVERDFAVVNRSRFVRVGLCDRNDLINTPAYINNEIQFERFTDTYGQFQIAQKLFGISLPGELGLNVRKDAGRRLLEGYQSDVLSDMASQLNISDRIPSNVSLVDKRTVFLDNAFSSHTMADKFSQIIDLSFKF